MYILKNALRNIFRNKGKNILIMIIALVIALSACIALSIRQSAETAREDAVSDMEITANISFDRSKMMQNMQDSNSSSSDNKDNMKQALRNMDSLSVEEMETYAKCQSVKDFYYTGSASLNASGSLEAVDSSIEDTETTDNSQRENMPGGMTPPDGNTDLKGGPQMRGGMGSMGDFTLIGYSSEKAMTDFIDGSSKISDGALFDTTSSDKNCIISNELATLNSLKVGDTIKLQNPNNEDEKIKFTITGIYTNTGSDDGSQMMGFNASQDKANQIYTSYKCLDSIVTKSEKNATTSTDDNTGMEMSSAIRKQVNGTYVFSSVENYEKFEDEARSAGLSDDYKIESNDVSQYESSLVPLENLSSFAGWFLLIVLIIGAIILVVFNMFSIRSRKYEIGVLTAIGMKKWKVALQFLTETFAITFIAIILGTVIGAVSSVPVTNALLENQISSTQSQTQQVEENFGRGGMQSPPDMPDGMMKNDNFKGGFMAQTTDYIDSVNSATDLMVVLELMLLGLGLTIVSSLASVIFVMRYEPLKILSQRD